MTHDEGFIKSEANIENAEVSHQALMTSCKFLNPVIPEACPIHGLQYFLNYYFVTNNTIC